MLHTLTPDGLDAIEDGLDCIALVLYHGHQGNVSPQMWNIFKQLLYIIVGDGTDPEGGYGFEYLSQVTVAIQNYISKDPERFLSVGEGNQETFIALTFKFIERALEINARTEDKLDALVILKILIAMLENLQGRIDEAIQFVVVICMRELESSAKGTKNIRSMVLQTLCMSLWYNSALTFELLKLGNHVIPFFQKLLELLPGLKHEFELRRVIFGLTAVISTNP